MEATTTYPEGSIGRLMEEPCAVFPPSTRIGDCVAELENIVKNKFVTYVFVTDSDSKLIGVVTMRDLLFSPRDATLESVMIRNVFSLSDQAELLDAMKETLNRHFPVYPVTNSQGVLTGLIRGSSLFEQQAIELSAQAGAMVGVEKEERLSTPLWRSFLFRHPWLQFNLLTAFVAAAVVGGFEETIAQVVALAVFLPVLSGQSGNTGCQALAVALRGMTLGELGPGKGMRVATKEGLLGLMNGLLTGITAGIAMWIFASWNNNADAGALAFVVFAAMTAACTVSGISGVVIPLALRKFGADPATASSIFLTTATDVVSMGLFLGLATWLVL